MSIDKSLKRKGSLTRIRCVMTRAERIAKLVQEGKFDDEQSPYGLPKVRVQKISLKKAKKPAKEEKEEKKGKKK